jgi:hypothetical protein
MAKATVEMVKKRILGGELVYEGGVDECTQAWLANEGDRLLLYVRAVSGVLIQAA